MSAMHEMSDPFAAQMKMDVSPLVNLFCSSSRPYLYCMCVKCGITRSSQKVSFTWFENYSKCLI